MAEQPQKLPAGIDFTSIQRVQKNIEKERKDPEFRKEQEKRTAKKGTKAIKNHRKGKNWHKGPKDTVKDLENLWRDSPRMSALHGVRAQGMLNKYSNRTTKEGKALGVIMDQIEEDIGPDFDARQHLIIAQIRSKLIVILQIGKYLESLPDVIIKRTGTMPKVLSTDFPKYSQTLTMLLDKLYASSNGKKKPQSYRESVDELIAETSKQ